MLESDFKFQNLWKPFLIAAMLAFVYAAVLVKLGTDWWTDENYSHGLLVPFVIGYIVWLEFKRLKKFAKNPSVWQGLAIISVAFFLLLAGTLGAELFTQRISLVVMLAGIVVYFFGARLLQKIVIPFLLLLLAIPIPQIIFNKIAFPLQVWASQAAVWGIRLFEIPSVRKGNVFEILPQGATQIVALEVVEACSGIRSLMTLVTLALVLAYLTADREREVIDGGRFHFLKNFDFWRAALLMLSAVPVAILTNAARVTATGVLTYYYGKQAAGGFWHELSGWLVYLVALALLIGINVILQKIRRSPSLLSSSAADSLIQSEIPCRSRQQWAPVTGKSIYWLLAALLMGGIFINWLERRGELSPSRQPLSELPAQLGEWRQKGTDTRFSEQTESVLRATEYVTRDYILPNGKGANLYVGYYASQRSGATYHSPQNCLPGAGWELKNPELVEIKTPAGKSFAANRYIVQNGENRAILIYWYQGRGRASASEYQDKIYTVLDSIFERRSDGAMVRVMMYTGATDEESATRAAMNLSAEIADHLSPFVPD